MCTSVRWRFGLAPFSRSALIGLAVACAGSWLPAAAHAIPRVISTTPADQAVGVALGSNLVVQFAGLIQAATINPANVLVTTSLRGEISGSIIWNAPGRRMTFDPDVDFLPGERVLVTITKGVTDLGGVPLALGHHFQFTTWTAPQPQGGFVPSATGWPIGSIAFSLTVGDLDGDDLPEGIFVNVVPDSLTILSPDGAGGFTPFAQLSTHSLPRHSVVADVDVDGLLDIVCAESSDTLDVFRNQGGGTFVRDSYAVPSGTTPYGAFVADLDADGTVDVATANFNGQNVSVLLGNGDGTFAASVEYAAGDSADSPRYVDGADFDGDGDIDLACCNGYSYDVSVLLNDGDGAFTAQAPLIPVGQSPNFLEARDYTGDGLVDLVTINSLSETLSLLRGNGDGTFQPTVEHPTGGPFPFGITSVDVDGDGDLDVVIPIRGLDGWRTMWNDGNGGFSQGTLYLGGLHCHSIGAADWDGDGDIDILAGYAISSDMYFYEQVPTPVVAASSPAFNFTGAPITDDVTLFFNADLDPVTVTPAAFQVVGSQSGPHTVTATWDGSQKSVVLAPAVPFLPGEIVCVTANGTGKLKSADGLAHDGHVLEFMTEGGPSPASFAGLQVALPGSDPVAIAAADLDGDEAADLVIANFLSADVTFLLTGGGGLPAVSGSFAVGVGPVDLWTGDLDGNGFVDVVTANTVSGTVSLLMNQGGAAFQAGTPLVTTGAPFAVRGGDFDLDGDTDLAVAELGPDAIRVFWNDSTGTFSSYDSLGVAGPPLDLAIADLDQDGDLDLVSVDSGNNRIEVFHYGVGGFSLAGSFATGSVPVSTFPWDTDGDGWIDLVSSDYSGGGISVLQNLGDGASFAPALNLIAGDQPHGLWGADLTGDGLLDLVTANSGGSNLTLFQNQGAGVFDGGSALVAGETPYAVTGGDWDGNGTVDLATVNRTSGDLTILLNGATSTAAAPIAPSLLATGLTGAGPNPFRESAAVTFQLARNAHTLLRVYDLRGRVVAELQDGLLPAGPHQALWDGRDRRGARVATGVYFVRMDAEDRSWTRKLLHLR